MSLELLELPLVLIYAIVLRLPLKTIMSLMCVSKTFQKIVLDPYFAHEYISKAQNRDSLMVQDKTNATKLFLVSGDNVEKTQQVWHWKEVSMPDSLYKLYKPRASILGSCNGLLCLNIQFPGLPLIYVCNPVLNKFTPLPNLKRGKVERLGFGFCPKTKRYKVLWFLPTGPCEIHTLGTDMWRTIESVPYPRYSQSSFSSFNGSLHWSTESSKSADLICSFSLETEKFHYISPPALFNEHTIKRMEINAGTLGGLFCVWSLLDQALFEVFVMKDYGMNGVWTKEIRVNLWPILENVPLAAIKFLDRGLLLVNYLGLPLYCYIPREGTSRGIVASGYYDTIDLTPSFVSLRKIVPKKMVEMGIKK